MLTYDYPVGFKSGLSDTYLTPLLEVPGSPINAVARTEEYSDGQDSAVFSKCNTNLLFMFLGVFFCLNVDIARQFIWN